MMQNNQEKPDTPAQRAVDGILSEAKAQHYQHIVDDAVKEMGLQPVKAEASNPQAPKVDAAESKEQDIEYSNGLGM